MISNLIIDLRENIGHDINIIKELMKYIHKGRYCLYRVKGREEKHLVDLTFEKCKVNNTTNNKELFNGVIACLI